MYTCIYISVVLARRIKSSPAIEGVHIHALTVRRPFFQLLRSKSATDGLRGVPPSKALGYRFCLLLKYHLKLAKPTAWCVARLLKFVELLKDVKVLAASLLESIGVLRNSMPFLIRFRYWQSETLLLLVCHHIHGSS